MQHSRIITEELLDSRADFAESRGLIPQLIFRLIAASIKNPKELRLPYGGSVGQPGWDGKVVSPQPFEPYVPIGQSFWEIGTGADSQDKATREFKKRTEQTTEDERRESTFVFITPRSALRGWTDDHQKKWIGDRKKTTNWKDIRVIDGTKLIQWLYLFPSIELWLAGEFDIPNKGISFPLLHWEELKNYGPPPSLTPDIFLIGRQKVVDELLKIFNGEKSELLLKTQYPKEGVDFVTAALASLEPAKQAAYAGRCMIIDDPETWKAMCTLQNTHVFVATPSLDIISTGSALRVQARNKGHGVIFAGIPLSGVHGNSISLTEPKPYELEKVLISCGYSAERARSVSNKCGGRIMVFKRLLLDISTSPYWATSDEASELAIASLIGQWDANLEGDREAVEGILGKEYGEWTGKIRPMTLRPDPPLIQRNEKWRFISRFEGWQTLGPYISNNDLDRFKEQALIVLRTKDPKFTLPPEERWKAEIHKKFPKYSDTVKQGIAETLALLGTHPKTLTSCSIGKPQTIASITVREIFKDTDWMHWATLNDVLPLLAEASPEEFLEAVESLLSNPENKIFNELFSQEGKGFMGGSNYMTGVLWALETLAWHKDYLTRVTIIFGRLADIDPHLGNWGNRPENSLTTIFLPWFPQTCAPIEIRRVAIETLLRELPDVGWKILLTLLPGSHQVSSGCRKPSWRDFIPLEYSERVLQKEYFTQVAMYVNLATHFAKTNVKKLSELIKRLDDLPLDAFNEMLSHLSSKSIFDLKESERVELWEALVDITVRHRKYADAEWAMPKEKVDMISDISNNLKPTAPVNLHRRIFCQNEFELIEEKDNYEEQRKKLSEKRTTAIKEILELLGIEGVLSFTLSINDSFQVGLALGKVASGGHDIEIIPNFLLHTEKKIQDFVAGYVWSRLDKKGWSWVDNINFEEWNHDQKSAFFSLLPFGSGTWNRVRNILKENEVLYWRRTNARPYELKDDELDRAVDLLLQNNRPKAAIQCLSWMLHKKTPPSTDIVFRALLDSLTSKEPMHSIDYHDYTELIHWLQKQNNVDQDELSKIEWLYLPLLDRNLDLSPKTLEKRLSEDPEFFCEVIRTVFRSEKEKKSSVEPSEEKKRVAHNAYDLLLKWKTPPGTKSDGTFDGALLKKWLHDVTDSCEKSGHLRIALDQVGKILAHYSADPSGLWIHKEIAGVLNEEDYTEMRNAFIVELLNQRGVFTFSAGEQEKAFATEYRQRAYEIEKEGFYILAASIRGLADYYDRESEREASRDPFED